MPEGYDDRDPQDIANAQKRKPHVNTLVDHRRKNDIQMPVDYTFKSLPTIGDLEMTDVRRSRFGNIIIGKHQKYLSRTLWFNHNKISDTENLTKVVNNIFEFPDRLGFLDLSRNQLKQIDASLLTLKGLKILYLHDNKISELEEIYKLRQLKHLRTLTLYANPIYENERLGNPRTVVKYLLPGLEKLDFNILTGIETRMPVGALVVRFLAKMEGRILPYIPCKLRGSLAKKGEKHKRERDLHKERSNGGMVQKYVDLNSPREFLEVCVCAPCGITT